MPAILGLGISGATLARALAEEGFRVHCFEREDRIGGMAYHGKMTFICSDARVRAFLSGKIVLKIIDDQHYAPAVSWRAACEELLAHRNINWLSDSTLWHGLENIERMAKDYDLVFISAPLDAICANVYGRLSYKQGVPEGRMEDRLLYSRYREALVRLRCVPFGYHGLYLPLNIETCMKQAIELAHELKLEQQALLQKQMHEAIGTRDDVLGHETQHLGDIVEAVRLRGVQRFFDNQQPDTLKQDGVHAS